MKILTQTLTIAFCRGNNKFSIIYSLELTLTIYHHNSNAHKLH